MAYKRKGQLTSHIEWAKHLRKYWKRNFWRGERIAEQNFIKFELNEMYKGLYQMVSEVLWNDWDPIGLNDEGPQDEYESYVPEICSMIMKKESNQDIAERLFEIETRSIGVEGNIEHCLKVANILYYKVNDALV